MDKIYGVFGSVPKSTSRHDGDLSDFLCFPYTTILFSIFAIIVQTKQFVGEPIQCWVPAHMTGTQEEYVNDYCWLGNSYYLPLDENVPKEDSSEPKQMIPYYHWVPIMLLVQALLFYVPLSIWRTLCRRSGMDVEDVVKVSKAFIELEREETRDKTMGFMMTQIDRYLSMSRQYALFCETSTGKQKALARIRFNLLRFRGHYLTASYFVLKALCIANVLGQLFFLNKILGTGFHLYGFEVLNRIFLGDGDQDVVSPRFPRTTMCDFKVRRLGNVHRYTVHCVVPINLFNEKIYLIVWFWMVFVLAALVRSALTWAIRLLSSYGRRHYVKGHLSIMPPPRGSDPADKREQKSSQLDNFIQKYLKYDGVFILRLIGHNTSSLTVTELTISLWQNFQKKPMVDLEKDAGGSGDKKSRRSLPSYV